MTAITTAPTRRTGRHTRRGGIYLAVLGSAMIVAILGMSAIAVSRLEQLASEATADAMKSRAYAESAIELGMLEVRQNPTWRLRPHGTWAGNQTIGDGTYTLQVIDPGDGNLANDPRDPVVIRGIGEKGQARHIIEVTMADTGSPISALSSALAATGDLEVASGRAIKITGAPVTSNGTLRNNGTIDGDAAALVVLNLGTITGSTTILAAPRVMPPAGLVAGYVKMGTEIPPSSTIEEVVLTPKYTSYGVTNSDGIYVLNAPGDVTIRNLRVEGTLVIICPGSTVRIDQSVFIANARPDCPALIVHGNLDLRFDRTPLLRESDKDVNYNPPGAPYLGVEDTDRSDSYPSEIRGLVHATGTVRLAQTSRIIGAVIGESPALLNGIQVDGTPEIVYSARLTESPPMGYSLTPAMRLRAGSWRRVTLP